MFATAPQLLRYIEPKISESFAKSCPGSPMPLSACVRLGASAPGGIGYRTRIAVAWEVMMLWSRVRNGVPRFGSSSRAPPICSALFLLPKNTVSRTVRPRYQPFPNIWIVST